MKAQEAVYVWSHTRFVITDDLPDIESPVQQDREWRTANWKVADELEDREWRRRTGRWRTAQPEIANNQRS
jgi:hypothetical protein